MGRSWTGIQGDFRETLDEAKMGAFLRALQLAVIEAQQPVHPMLLFQLARGAFNLLLIDLERALAATPWKKIAKDERHHHQTLMLEIMLLDRLLASAVLTATEDPNAYE